MYAKCNEVIKIKLFFFKAMVKNVKTGLEFRGCFGSVLYLISLYSIRDAVTFINSIEVNKLSRLLSRILQKLHLKV